MGLVFRVKYHPAVLKDDIPKLSGAMKTRIRNAIETKLMTRPDLYAIPLRQSLSGHRKLRVGNYRIVFNIERRTIFVLVILNRSVVYQKSQKRK